MVEVGQIIIHEANEPNEVADLFDADALAGEDGAEIDFLAIEADSAACGDGDDPEWSCAFRRERPLPLEKSFGAQRPLQAVGAAI